MRHRKRWSNKEMSLALRMKSRGKRNAQIAAAIGRTERGIRGKFEKANRA